MKMSNSQTLINALIDAQNLAYELANDACSKGLTVEQNEFYKIASLIAAIEVPEEKLDENMWSFFKDPIEIRQITGEKK